MEHFRAGMDFLNEIKEIAEKEGHHPDVHLTSYRNVTVELYTHAIGNQRHSIVNHLLSVYWVHSIKYPSEILYN
jgi:pterin-4a-carbinolamine dehydratase